MNSIKTFWSPELKKERLLRKEESAKYNNLIEQYRMARTEKEVRNLKTFCENPFALLYRQFLACCDDACGPWTAGPLLNIGN